MGGVDARDQRLPIYLKKKKNDIQSFRSASVPMPLYRKKKYWERKQSVVIQNSVSWRTLWRTLNCRTQMPKWHSSDNLVSQQKISTENYLKDGCPSSLHTEETMCSYVLRVDVMKHKRQNLTKIARNVGNKLMDVASRVLLQIILDQVQHSNDLTHFIHCAILKLKNIQKKRKLKNVTRDHPMCDNGKRKFWTKTTTSEDNYS